MWEAILFVLAAVLSALGECSLVTSLKRETQQDAFNWTGLIPSTDLRYHDCYNGFRCARLQVPMDWSDRPANLTLEDSVAIAIVTLPAKVPHTHPKYGGTVLINPGGPGGSGTNFALVAGSTIQEAIDGDRHYSILGFDPRAVFRTTPNADCFGDAQIRNDLFWQSRGWLPFRRNVLEQWLFNRALNEQCEKLDPKILQHMSTGSVARDMVEIADRIEELERQTSPRPSVQGHASEKPKVQYFGVSYGSALGMTFASMFPDRVGRVVVDAIVDMEEYSRGVWTSALSNTEEILDHFYQECFASGDACALRDSNDGNWTDLKDRVVRYLADLAESPAPVPYRNRYTLITDDDIRDLMLNTLYAAASNFPTLSQLLSEMIVGNYSSAIEYIQRTTNSPEYPSARDVRSAVLFTDAHPEIAHKDVEWFRRYSKVMSMKAPTIGSSHFVDYNVGLIGRRQRDKLSHLGPWGIPTHDSEVADAPNPLLFLSARLDPVTPLRNARQMVDRFDGARLLVQESAGHGAFFSAPSNCTRHALKDYFAYGILPVNGKICQADCQPFTGCSNAQREK